MSKTDDIEYLIRELNGAYARGAISDAEYERQDARLRAKQAEIKAWIAGQGRGNKEIRDRGVLSVAVLVPPMKVPTNSSEGECCYVLPPGSTAAVEPRLPLRRTTSPEARARRIVTRRRVAASGMLPHQLAGHFTLSEQAVLTALAYEVMAKGLSALTWAQLGNRAGTSRCLVKRTMRKAREIGMLSITEQRGKWLNGPNLVRILDPLWLRWIARRKQSQGGINRPGAANGSRKRWDFEAKGQPVSYHRKLEEGCRRAGGDGGHGPGGPGG